MRSNKQPANARGFVMVFVLGAVMLITLLAVGAVAVNRVRLQSVTVSSNGAHTSADAQSALELGMHLLSIDPNGFAWRDDPNFAVSGTFGTNAWSVKLEDTVDTDLRSGDNTSLTMHAIASNDVAAKGWSVDLVPTNQPMTALNHALVVTGSQATPVQRSIEGTEYNSTVYRPSDVTWSDAAPFSMTTPSGLLIPDNSVIQSWMQQATTVDIDTIPSRTAEKRVLAPGLNPWGTSNAKGIYVIDCKNKVLTFQDMRVYGTLIIVNPAAGSIIRRCNIEAPPGQPALLVRGNITVESGHSLLSEDAIDRNLNPTGAPHLASTDKDESDKYPVVICGLVYIFGNVTPTSMYVHGSMIVDGNIAGTAGFLRIVGVPQQQQIPGFVQTTAWRVVPGTLRRMTN
jgi:hypothetical protein